MNYLFNNQSMMQFTKVYFLFGEEICAIYYDSGIEAVIAAITEGLNFSLYVWDHITPIDLLESYDGWYDYAVITMEEYNRLQLILPAIEGLNG